MTVAVNSDEKYIIYYYLGKDRTGAISAVLGANNLEKRRRINQMHLFFCENYEFSDDLAALREDIGF